MLLEREKGQKRPKIRQAELEASDIMPIDGLIAFAESDAGAQVFAPASEECCSTRQGDQSRRSKIL